MSVPGAFAHIPRDVMIPFPPAAGPLHFSARRQAFARRRRIAPGATEQYVGTEPFDTVGPVTREADGVGVRAIVSPRSCIFDRGKILTFEAPSLRPARITAWRLDP